MVPPKSHDQCQGEMCCTCGEKAGRRKVLESLGILIQKWAQPIWSPDDTSYLVGSATPVEDYFISVSQGYVRLLVVLFREQTNGKLSN